MEDLFLKLKMEDLQNHNLEDDSTQNLIHFALICPTLLSYPPFRHYEIPALARVLISYAFRTLVAMPSYRKIGRRRR
jgi:hypothetical protein